MKAIAGMPLTGRRQRGAAYEVVEVVADSGLKHLAFAYNDQFLLHPSVASMADETRAFLSSPGTTGLSRMVAQDTAQGAFVYATGTVCTLAELMAVGSEQGGFGLRAGVELAYQLAEILVEASDNAGKKGLAIHARLDPWKVALKPEGQVVVVGYGLPRVDVDVFLAHPTRLPKEDALRYCAPEELKSHRAGIQADLYVTTLLALELTKGRPVHDGLADDIRQQVLRGESVRKLYEWREELTDGIRKVWSKALKPDSGSRIEPPYDYVYAMHELLSDGRLSGPSLLECLKSVSSVQASGEGVALSEPKRPRPVQALPEAEAPRWTSTVPKRTLEGAAPRNQGEHMSDESARDRLKKRLRGRSPSGVSTTETAPPSDEAPKQSAREALKSRLKGRSPAPKGEPASVASVPEPEPASPEEEVQVTATAEVVEEEPALTSEAPSTGEEEDALPAQPAPEPEPAPEPAPEATPAPAQTTAPSAAELLARLKSSMNTGAAAAPAVPALRARGASDSISLTIREDGALRVIEIPSGTSVTDALAAVTSPVGPGCYDMLGGLVGWKHAEQAGKRLTPTMLVEDLDLAEPMDLVRVENRLVRVNVEVRGASAEPIRYATPVGTAVPVGALLAYLSDWLGLPESDWQLQLDGITLHPSSTLDEASVADGSLLVVLR